MQERRHRDVQTKSEAKFVDKKHERTNQVSILSYPSLLRHDRKWKCKLFWDRKQIENKKIQGHTSMNREWAKGYSALKEERSNFRLGS